MDSSLQEGYEKIKQQLKIKFGLPTNSPSFGELENILLTIRELKPEERTEKKWREAIYKYVKDAGTYKYLGLDTSDLNFLYSQLLMQLNKQL